MPIRLDERLTEIARLAAGAHTVCDVGSDHGKLACYLVQTGGAERAIATDISAPSLKKAEVLAEKLGIDDLVETRVGDGLDPVGAEEADVAVIAGMGGDLIARILERAHAQCKRFRRLVLAPNTHAERVRETLWRTGHTETADRTVACGGKRYTVIAAEQGDAPEHTAEELAFGRSFRTDAAFVASAKEELGALERALADNPSAEKLAARAEMLKKALEECEI